MAAGRPDVLQLQAIVEATKRRLDSAHAVCLSAQVAHTAAQDALRDAKAGMFRARIHIYPFDEDAENELIEISELNREHHLEQTAHDVLWRRFRDALIPFNVNVVADTADRSIPLVLRVMIFPSRFAARGAAHLDRAGVERDFANLPEARGFVPLAAILCPYEEGERHRIPWIDDGVQDFGTVNGTPIAVEGITFGHETGFTNAQYWHAQNQRVFRRTAARVAALVRERYDSVQGRAIAGEEPDPSTRTLAAAYAGLRPLADTDDAKAGTGLSD